MSMAVDVEAERVPATYAMQVRENAGIASLGVMSDDEFKNKLGALEKTLHRLRVIKDRVLVPGEDFDVVPGTKKMALLKPGAEKLGMITSLAPSFQVQRIVGDGSKSSPYVTYVVTCRLHRGDTAGPVVAEGVGSCNSNEKKYRYRSAERSCPVCGKTGTVIKGKEQYGGGYLCFGKKGGCGAKFPDDDPNIVGQNLGDIEHPDPLDLDNTLLKMGKKRSHVDAALTATASSGMFTQDMEESVTPEQRAAEQKRLSDAIVAVFTEANIPLKDRPVHCSRLMNEKVTSLSALSLVKLKLLLDRLEEDSDINALRHAGDMGKDDGDPA